MHFIEASECDKLSTTPKDRCARMATWYCVNDIYRLGSIGNFRPSNGARLLFKRNPARCQCEVFLGSRPGEN